MIYNVEIGWLKINQCDVQPLWVLVKFRRGRVIHKLIHKYCG